MSTTRHTNGSIPCCADEIRAEPQWPRWPRLVEANPSFYDGRPSRRVGQEELLKKARQYTGGTLGLTCPSPRAGTHVVATGHQPFWHHCGVWVKTLACSRLAQAVHGTAVHVVLDHDVCDTGLTIPQPGANGTWERRRLALEPGRAAGPVELRRPDAASVERFVEELTRAHPDQLCNMLWMQFDAAEAVRSGRLRTMADLVTDLQAVLNAPFGADDVLYLPVSQLSATDAFLDFAVSAMSNAMYFAQCYNDAVARCRPGRHGRLVIPPLALDAARGQTELPFWLVRSEGDRASLHVQLRSAGVLSLGATAGEAGPLGGLVRSRYGWGAIRADYGPPAPRLLRHETPALRRRNLYGDAAPLLLWPSDAGARQPPASTAPSATQSRAMPAGACVPGRSDRASGARQKPVHRMRRRPAPAGLRAQDRLGVHRADQSAAL
jgi:hypothetical protein